MDTQVIGSVSQPADPVMTLVDLVRLRARQWPDRCAYTFLPDGDTEELQLTYAELDRRARAVAALLQKHWPAGERALLFYPMGLDYIVAFFGCLYAGIVAVPAYPPRLNRGADRVAAIHADAGAAVILTTVQLHATLASRLANTPEWGSTRWQTTDDAAGELAGQWKQPAIEAATLAFLQYTSGSTATPRGVMVSHGNLLHNERVIQETFQISSDDVIVGWLPLYHDMGLIGNVIQPLYSAARCILMPPTAFLQAPVRWLNAISRYRGTVSGGPNFAYELCLRKIPPEQDASLDLSRWVVAYNGAEPVHAATLERFAARFEASGFRRSAFCACYGLAESTLMVSGSRRFAQPSLLTLDPGALTNDRVALASEADSPGRTLVGCGAIASDHHVRIVNPRTSTPCLPGQVGEIWLSGPSVSQGYWNRPEDTAQTFRASLAGASPGPFLRTGDLGFAHNGELYISGRLKDLIIIRGRNHYPQDIEFSVGESHPALQPGSGSAFSIELEGEEHLVVVHELRRSYRQVEVEPIAQAVRQAVAEQHELQVYAVVLIKSGSLPKTSSGKIQRLACRAGFLDNSLAVVGCSYLPISQAASPDPAGPALALAASVRLLKTEFERREWLRAYLCEQIARALHRPVSQLDPQNPPGGYGLDSLQSIALQHQIETDLDVALPMASLLGSQTIEQLVSDLLGQCTSPSARPAAAIAPASDPHPVGIPLSPGQQGLWFLHQLDPRDPGYHLAHAVRVRSEFDLAAMQRAFEQLILRHAPLRTTVSAPGGQPVQNVHQQIPFAIQHDRTALRTEALLAERLAQLARIPFELTTGPLFRVHLLTGTEGDPVLLLVLHHLIADFWSLATLLKEFGELYRHETTGEAARLEPLPFGYGEFARWYTDQLRGPEGERRWDYWRRALTGVPAALSLPVDRMRRADQPFSGLCRIQPLSLALVRRLKELSQRNGATLYMTLLAAFQVLLYRYSGQERFLVGSPVSGRSRAEFRNLVGYFVETLPLPADLSGNPGFEDLLARVRRLVLDAFEYQEYPLIWLVERLQPDRDLHRAPLFQTMFVHYKMPVPGLEPFARMALAEPGVRVDLGGLILESVAFEQPAAPFDIHLKVAEQGDALVLALQCDERLFDPATVARILEHYQVLLEGVIADPRQTVLDLPMLTPAEIRQQESWNATATPYPGTACIHQLFEARVSQAPDAVAVVFGQSVLSYSSLNHQANQLAHYLRALGVGPETRVGVCLPRSPGMLIALLGILKAGGAYVPLDPDYPKPYLANVMADGQLPVVVTLADLARQRLPAGVRAVYLDAEQATLSQYPAGDPRVAMDSANLAYAIYTSGSTGRPKGVMISHQSVINFFEGMDQRLGCQPADTLMAVTSISFDISVLELFWTLTRGVRIVLSADAIQAQPASATRLKAQERPMAFSLFYFASDEIRQSGPKYRLLLEGARFADAHGFEAIWVPERHFHPFGGLYPNPAVLAAALAAMTDRVQLRAGSVVLPLHHPLRVAEEWSVVDNLSHGRAGIAFASGWHADDFAFFPERYPDRKAWTWDGIEIVRRLWQGKPVRLPGGGGNEIEVRIFPQAVQPELPTWVTAAGELATFIKAGELGANLLTHLLGQTIDELAEKIRAYREAFSRKGDPARRGRVTLMLHTFVGEDLEAVKETVRRPFCSYLRSSVGLLSTLVKSLGLPLDLETMSERDMADLLDFAFARYFDSSALFGTPQTCLAMIETLKAIGVDEIACLIDFGVETETVLASLAHLNRLRELANASPGEASLLDPIAAHRVSLLQCTPSLMKILLLQDNALPSLSLLRWIALGGEALPSGLAMQLHRTLAGRLFNMYGPTETTVWSATYPVVDERDPVPIGRPIANTQIYILTPRLQPVPIGVAGEVCIAGDGLARGYLDRPDLTAERFLPDPMSRLPGARLYRTGDLGRYLPDGNIEFLGRVDDQIKLRGFRIEPAEIAAVLETHPDVREAVITSQTMASGETLLIAYFVTRQNTVVAPGELRVLLAQNLPEYKIPALFVAMNEFPLTANGKIDRRALPDPWAAGSFPPEIAAAPRNPVEALLADLWAQVLGVGQVDIHESFFTLGGHSLIAAQLMSRVRDVFEVDVPLKHFFERPTVAGLAEHIESARQTGASPARPPLRPASRLEPLPLSFAQYRLWFMDRLQPGSPAYIVHQVMRLSGRLDQEALHRAVRAVVSRHEVLRTTIVLEDGMPVQVVVPEVDLVPIEWMDLSHHPPARRDAEVEAASRQAMTRPFDVSRGPMMRVQLIRLAPDAHLLLMTLPHIACDGWSLAIIARELVILYESFASGQTPPLPALALQYADFAVWQRQWLQGQELADLLAYWRRHMTGAPERLLLPTDWPRPAVLGSDAAIHARPLPGTIVQALRDWSRQTGVTMFMTLIAAYQALVSQYTQQEDLVIGIDVASRTQTELENLVGFFVNQLPLRTRIVGSLEFRALVEQVRETLLESYRYQDLPFDKLVEALNPKRDMGYAPIFQTKVTYMRMPALARQLTDLKMEVLNVSNGVERLDLTLAILDTEKELVVSWIYNTALFVPATLERWAAEFESVLQYAVDQPEISLDEMARRMQAERRQQVMAQKQYRLKSVKTYVPKEVGAS